jgi:DNA repair protein RadC
LVKYGSEALDTVEHLGLVLNNQSTALSLLEHFGSVANLTRASVQDFLQFVSPAQAAQLVCALRLAAVALREEHWCQRAGLQSLEDIEPITVLTDPSCPE